MWRVALYNLQFVVNTDDTFNAISGEEDVPFFKSHDRNLLLLEKICSAQQFENVSNSAVEFSNEPHQVMNFSIEIFPLNISTGKSKWQSPNQII